MEKLSRWKRNRLSSDYRFRNFIPGFEEQLVGAEIGKETEVNVTFPKEYQAKELAGKAAVFKCTVKKIEVKELPELDTNSKKMFLNPILWKSTKQTSKRIWKRRKQTLQNVQKKMQQLQQQ